MTKEELLQKLYEAETPEEIRRLGEELLNLDSDSPYGKLAIWETMDYEESIENLDMIHEALDKIRAIINAKDMPTFIDEDRDANVYCSLLMNYGFSLLTKDRLDEAYEIAKEFANFDDEGVYPSRTLLYRTMLDLGLYNEILTTLESDPLESVVGEHARAIALLETGATDAEVRDAINNAIAYSPDVPFLITQIWEFPEQDEEIDEEFEEIVNDATYLSDPWNKTEKRFAALCGPTYLFGYLTDRLTDDKEISVIRKSYREAGILQRVDKLKNDYKNLSDNGANPDEIDAKAIAETSSILDEIYSED